MIRFLIFLHILAIVDFLYAGYFWKSAIISGIVLAFLFIQFNLGGADGK